MIGIDKLPTWLALALGCGSLTTQATEPPTAIRVCLSSNGSRTCSDA